LRRANRYFGGARATLSALRPVARDLARTHARTIALLDLATGSADIPVAMLALAEREGWSLRVVATDVQPEVLEIASLVERKGKLEVEWADARNLPYGDATFDVVTLSLALHHFEPVEAARVLAEMRRVGRHALIVNDLARSWPGYAGAWIFGHMLSRNRLTRHDAPLSVRRAYSAREALTLARWAGWRAASVRRANPFRFVLTGRP
jgi:SAM-dependent methyltransferase